MSRRRHNRLDHEPILFLFFASGNTYPEHYIKKVIHQPGFEPGFERWQRPVMTATLLMFYDDAQTRIRTGDNCLFRAALSH